MDDQPGAGPPATGGPTRKPPGPERTYLDQLRRAKFLELIASGKGIDLALRDPDVNSTYRVYRNTAADFPDFREEVDSARRSADQTLDEVGHLLAHHNPDVLLEIWKRRDQARLMRDARTDRRAERAEDRRDRLRREKAERRERDKERALRLHLAEMAADARAKERAAKAGAAQEPEVPVDLSRLTPDELATYRAIARKLLGDAADEEPA